MSLPTPRRRRASKGDVVARAAGTVAVMAGLAAAVGLMAGDGWEAHASVDSTIPCASPANAPFAAL
jgi:hypothetical protein